MKVFIVDDSKVVCERLKEMMASIDEVEVIGQAHNAGEAITAISKLKPDVVILDIRMPGPSGIEVLKNIRKKMLPVSVVVLTNYPYPQYRKKCEELEVDYFLDKVAEIEKVPHAIMELKRKARPGIKSGQER